MPTYEHLCLHCTHEWEDMYSIKADPPTICPKCGTEGMVKRLVSGGCGRGIVTLTGYELAAHCKAEGRKTANEAMKDENLRANLIGEDRYHNQLLETDRVTNDLVKIGSGIKETKSGTKKGVVRRVGQKSK